MTPAFRSRRRCPATFASFAMALAALTVVPACEDDDGCGTPGAKCGGGVADAAPDVRPDADAGLDAEVRPDVDAAPPADAAAPADVAMCPGGAPMGFVQAGCGAEARIVCLELRGDGGLVGHDRCGCDGRTVRGSPWWSPAPFSRDGHCEDAGAPPNRLDGGR